MINVLLCYLLTSSIPFDKKINKNKFLTPISMGIGFKQWKKKRVKYIFSPCGLKLLFFAPSVFIFFIGDTYAMEKDGDGTSVHFSVQNWRISTSATRGCQFFFKIILRLFFLKKKKK
jgi:hypothetical protein